LSIVLNHVQNLNKMSYLPASTTLPYLFIFTTFINFKTAYYVKLQLLPPYIYVRSLASLSFSKTAPAHMERWFCAINISQGSVAMRIEFGGIYLMITLLQTSCWVRVCDSERILKQEMLQIVTSLIRPTLRASCNFMPRTLVRQFQVLHFHALHFQRPRFLLNLVHPEEATLYLPTSTTLLYRVWHLKSNRPPCFPVNSAINWNFYKKIYAIFSFMSTYNCQTKLYYHNIWQSYAFWTFGT